MSKIFLGDITDESLRLLERYLKKYMPDAEIEPLKPAGIKGKMKNKAGRPDVVLVILDERLYDMCKGVAGSILSLPKVHKYDNYEGFKKFLESKFGVLDSAQATSPEPEPIESVKEETPTSVKDTVAEELKASLETLEVDDDFGSLTVSAVEDTLNDKDKDDIIRKLNDDIIAKDTMIRNLEAQVEEKSGSRDVSHFVARIKALEEELDSTKKELSTAQNASFADLGKVTRAEQILDTVDSLKEELKQEKEKCLLLEASKSSLTTEILSKKSELQKVTEELETSSRGNKELTSKVSELEETISSLQSDYDLKVSELEDLISKNKDLDERVIELTSQVAEIGVLNDKVDSLSSENKNLQAQVSDLSKVKIDLENLRVDYDRVSSEKESLSQKVNDLQSKLNDASTSNEKLERSITSLTSDNESLSSQLNEISSKLSTKDDEIERLLSKVSDNEGVSSQLSISTERVKELEDEVDNLKLQLKQFEDTKASLSDKISEVEELQNQLRNKTELEMVLSQRNAEISSIKSELADKVQQLNSLTEERKSQSSIVEEKDSELASKILEVSRLTEEVKDLSSKLADRDSLDSDNRKLKNEIEALRKNATNSQEIIQNSSELEKEVTECKRTIARLQSENTLLKEDLDKSRGTTNKDVEISKLRYEISDYKEKLRAMKDNNNEQSDEVTHLREKCASLEVSIVEKENQLKENESSIFSRMGNIALPKTVFNLSLDVPSNLPNMYVFASGSSESNLVTYQVLRRLCSSVNKQVLILDLVTDSYIDREFGADKIQSPIEFLQCKRPINDFVSRAKVGNTFVSSTAVNYLNSLFLLTVDWNTILSSLVGKTDIVIINIGCLNDTVSKILFNAFASVMQSHVVIKASPINLRTALLTLSGISSAKKSKISCVNFENSSKVMYQKLAQKFNTQILKDSDVLKL